MRKKIMAVLIILVIYCMFPAVFTLMFTGTVEENVSDELINGRRVVVKYKYSSKTIDVNKFIAMILAYRFESSKEVEVLKAQSIMIRTDIYRIMGDSMSIDSDELGMNYLTESQMKNRWGNEYRQNYDLIADCVASTGSMVICHNDNLIEARYTEVSTGKTLSGEKLLGEKYSYLVEADCSKDIECQNYLAVQTFSNKGFVKKLTSHFADIGLSEENPFAGIQIISKDETGYVLKMQVGNVIMTGATFSNILGINSSCMTIEAQADEIKITTKGKGDGFGLSVYTADIMAESGSGYEEILNYFYKDIVLTNM